MTGRLKQPDVWIWPITSIAGLIGMAVIEG
jgi:hypothetical protein